MAKSSVNLSARLFYTKHHGNGTSWFGLLEEPGQPHVLTLTAEETEMLRVFVLRYCAED